MPSLEDAKNGIQYLKNITTDELKFIDEVVADPYSHSREEIVSHLGVIGAILRSQETLNDLLVNQLLDFDKMIGAMVTRLEHQAGLHVPTEDKDELPHSRACGWRAHDHGPSCNENCPTCHGKPMTEAKE